MHGKLVCLLLHTFNKKDKVSGSESNRPGLNRALNELKVGDTLVVWKLDGG